MISDILFLKMSICKCSYRNYIEEELYGSYCDDCWKVIKKYNKCIICNSDVMNARLYVSNIYRIPLCWSCYSNKDLI